MRNYAFTVFLIVSILGICTAQTPPSVITTKNNDGMYDLYFRFETKSVYPLIGPFYKTWGSSTYNAGFEFDKFGIIDTVELTITAIENLNPTLQDVYFGNLNLSGCFLLVSERVKNIFEQFAIAEHRFYPAKLQLQALDSVQKVNKGYYLFQVLRQPLKDYHFEECVFKSYPLSEKYSVDKSLITYKKGFLNVKNFEQFWAELTNGYMGLGVETLVYNKKYNIACDLQGIWFDKAVLNKLIEHKIFEENTIHYFIPDAGHHVGYLTYKEAGLNKNNTDTTILLPR